MENSLSQATCAVTDTHLGSAFSTGVQCFRQSGFPLSNTPLIPKSLNTSEKFGLQNTAVLCQGRISLFLLSFIFTFYLFTPLLSLRWLLWAFFVFPFQMSDHLVFMRTMWETSFKYMQTIDLNTSSSGGQSRAIILAQFIERASYD